MSQIATAQSLYDWLHQSVEILRRGRREWVVLFLAAGCFGVAGFFWNFPDTLTLPEQFEGLVQWAWLPPGVLGVLGVALVFFWVYRKALPTELSTGELRPTAIKGPMAFGEQDGPEPDSCGALSALSDARRAWVVVLDQFEQLHPEVEAHRPVFELLREVGSVCMPPHRTTWIVAFRREFASVWLDIEREWDGFRPGMLSLKLFHKRQAAEILATLAGAADLSLDQALADELVENVAEKQGVQDLRHAAYRQAGGTEGLLVRYFKDQLDRFSEIEREAVLKAMIGLIDPDQNQRIAEGCSAATLAERGGLPANRLGRCLDDLALNRVRLLERIVSDESEVAHYRLPHERLIPVIRRLSGVLLAEVDQLRLALDGAFRAWQSQGKKIQYLLGATLLRRLKRLRRELHWGEDSGERREFVERSLRRRRRLRLGVAGVVLVFGVAGYWGWELVRAEQHRQYLERLGLPTGLYDFQGQLEELIIAEIPITHLDWVKADLKELSISGAPLSDLTQLPSTLTSLALRRNDLTSLEGIQNLTNLKTLEISASIETLEYLPESVRSLRIVGN